jgi:integrase
VYAVVAVSFAARNCEAAELNFEDFERTVTDETLPQGNANHARYVIHHKRAKQTGQASTDGNVSFVTGALEVSIIDEYMGCFTKTQRKDRFFRKIKLDNKKSCLVGTNANIGRNTLAMYARQAAVILEKQDSHLYTGHSWRRTAITLAANTGLSLVQLKNLSGHRSDTVVQGYINNSIPMKETTANAVSVSSAVAPPFSSSVGKRKKIEENEERVEVDEDKENSFQQALKKRGVTLIINFN